MRKIVRACLWLAIVPLAVGLGLWAGQAWSQQQRPPTLNEALGMLTAARAAAADANARAEQFAAQASDAFSKVSQAEVEIDRLKKLCGAPCEPKKEEK